MLQRLCVCARVAGGGAGRAGRGAHPALCGAFSSALSCSPQLMRLPSHTGCARESNLSYPEPLPCARAALQAVLGLEVTWRDADRLPAGRHVMVSNHSTTGDLMVLYSLRRRCVHLVNAALPPRVTQARPVGGAGRMGGHAERKRACDLRVGQTRLWPPWGAVIFYFLCKSAWRWSCSCAGMSVNTCTQGSPVAAACAGRPSIVVCAHSGQGHAGRPLLDVRACSEFAREWCACMRHPGARAQGRNSRVLLRHATKEVYEELAAPALTDPVHIFPGAISSACRPRQAAPLSPSRPADT